MAIDSLGSNTAVNYSQFSVSSTTIAQQQNDSGTPAPAATGNGGRFATAIEQTLSQLGGATSSSSTSSTSSTSGTSGSSSTQDPKQAEQAFAQSLFTALQSQFGQHQGAQGAQGGGEGGGHHHHHGGGGGGGRIAGALQGLAQQLSSSSGSDDSSSSSGASSSAVSNLQSSFNNLLAATGQSSSSTTLPQFLQNLSQNLQGSSNSGNLLSVKV